MNKNKVFLSYKQLLCKHAQYFKQIMVNLPVVITITFPGSVCTYKNKSLVYRMDQKSAQNSIFWQKSVNYDQI